MIIDTVKIVSVQSINLICGFTLTLIYAKNLDLREFSTIGLYFVYTALAAQLIEMGIGNALLRSYNSEIQKNRRHLIEIKYVAITYKRLKYIPLLSAIACFSIGPTENIDASNFIIWNILIFANYLSVTTNNYSQATSKFTYLFKSHLKNALVKFTFIAISLIFPSQICKEFAILALTSSLIISAWNWNQYALLFRFRTFYKFSKYSNGFNISKSKYDYDIAKFNFFSLLLNRVDYFIIKNYIDFNLVATYYMLQQIISPINIIYNTINTIRAPSFLNGKHNNFNYINTSILISALLLLGLCTSYILMRNALSDFIPYKYSYLADVGIYAIIYANSAGLLSMFNICHNKSGKIDVMNIQILITGLSGILLILISNGDMKKLMLALATLNLTIICFAYLVIDKE